MSRTSLSRQPILNLPSIIGLALVAVAAAIFSHPLLMLSFVVLIMIPGWLLTKLLRISLTIEERLIISLGFGLALIPVASCLLTLCKIPITSVTIFTLLMVAIVLLLRDIWSTGIFRRFTFTLVYWPNTHQLLLIGLLLISIVTRLEPVQHLEVPLFADPALQGMISRLIIEQGRIPYSWIPFAPIEFHHQPGFASIVAWIAIVSRQPIPYIILIVTNLLHAVFAMSIYVLAYTLFSNRLQAFVATLLAVCAIFPTATFVAGMNAAATVYFFVPLSAALIIKLCKSSTEQPKEQHKSRVSKPGNSRTWARFLIVKLIGENRTAAFLRHFSLHWSTLMALSLLFTGAILIHPSFLVFLLLITGPYILLFAMPSKKNQKVSKRALWITGGALLIACALTIPGIFQATSNHQLFEEQWNFQAAYINPDQRLSLWCFIEPVFFLFSNFAGKWYFYLQDFTLLQFLVTHRTGLIMAVLFVIAAVLVIRDRNRLGLYLMTVYLLFLTFSWFQSAYAVTFPGWRFIYPTRVKFLIILPVALILARLVKSQQEFRLSKVSSILASSSMLIFLLIVPYNLYALTRHLRSLANTTPVSASDKTAIGWIQTHVPKGALILNAIRDVEAGVFIGGAGQWIPTMTGHRILFPALSLTEDVLHPSFTRSLDLLRNLIDRGPSDPTVLQEMKSLGVRYLFLSPRVMSTRRDLFSPLYPRYFLNSAFYFLEYRNGDTYIFSVQYSDDF